jgi:hypothetical protein
MALYLLLALHGFANRNITVPPPRHFIFPYFRAGADAPSFSCSSVGVASVCVRQATHRRHDGSSNRAQA